MCRVPQRGRLAVHAKSRAKCSAYEPNTKPHESAAPRANRRDPRPANHRFTRRVEFSCKDGHIIEIQTPWGRINSGLLLLVKLPKPEPVSAAHVLQAFTIKWVSIAQPMHQTITDDQIREMALHTPLTQNSSTGRARGLACDCPCPFIESCS